MRYIFNETIANCALLTKKKKVLIYGDIGANLDLSSH
jgi:hypothetical protein